MIISFAWTTAALLAGAKTMTRRVWKPEHANRFKAGDLVDAYDRSPRVGGRKVATIRIIRDPWQQRTSLMTLEDREHEGLIWLEEEADRIQSRRSGWTWDDVDRLRPPNSLRFDLSDSWRGWFDDWREADEVVWVVDFELVEVVR